MWQHFRSLWGYIHTHTYTYRTQKAEKQQWLPTPSLLSDSQSPLDLQMSLTSFQSSLQLWFHDNARKSAPQTPWKQVKSKSFPADAENSPTLDHSHTSKEKSNFLALCWTVEMLHILSSHIPAPVKGRRGRKRGTALRNPILPLPKSDWPSVDSPPVRARNEAFFWRLQRWENKKYAQNTNLPSQKCYTISSNPKFLFSTCIPMGRIMGFVLWKDTEVTREQNASYGKIMTSVLTSWRLVSGMG